ncbi:MAG: nucleotidyltransferase domain-containing protein [Thermoleophilia bacterium]
MATETSSDYPQRPDEEVLTELVRRLVESIKPLRIILFGSAARGEMDSNSDLDVLVVMPDGVHRRRTAQAAYRSLKGLGFAKDIVVVTESDVRQHSGNPSLVLYPALRQGKELYHAAG